MYYQCNFVDIALHCVLWSPCLPVAISIFTLSPVSRFHQFHLLHNFQTSACPCLPVHIAMTASNCVVGGLQSATNIYCTLTVLAWKYLWCTGDWGVSQVITYLIAHKNWFQYLWFRDMQKTQRDCGTSATDSLDIVKGRSRDVGWVLSDMFYEFQKFMCTYDSLNFVRFSV